MHDRHARVVLDIETGRNSDAPRRLPDGVFNILVMGDFSGATRRPSSIPGASASPSASARPLRERQPVLVDRDDSDDVLRRFRPVVRFELGSGGPLIEIAFETLDDFHPDRLIERVPLLSSLAALRRDARAGRAVLAPPPTAGAEGSGPASTDENAAAEALPERPATAGGGSLLDQIVAGSEASAAGAAANADRDRGGEPPTRAEPTSPNDLHAYIDSLLAPHMIAEADPRQTALAAQIEDTMASVLRAILHHPEFQAVESVWRGVSLLVRRLETGARLRVFLLDASRAELDADLATNEAVESSALLRVLSDGAPAPAGAEPWSVVAGLYTFGESSADAMVLGRIAAAARHAGAPFIAAAAPSLAGLSSFASMPDSDDVHATSAPAWLALRGSTLADSVGLALPRLLLRAPYDEREEPCELIALDEMTSPPSHEDYLWGNPALACALLLGQTFAEHGWAMQPQALEIDRLPLHLYSADGNTVGKPCAEALLTDRSAARMLQAGLIPLLSMKNGDTVRVTAFQSIAAPPTPLAGAWLRERR
jgi:type VI secretion system protein ImpC